MNLENLASYDYAKTAAAAAPAGGTKPEATPTAAAAAEGRKWVLTAEAFDKLLRRLGDGEDAGRGGEKYLLLRRNLVRFFEGRGFPGSEEAADEVFNRLARKLEAGEEIGDLNQYTYGVARRLVLELHKARNREQKALNEFRQLTGESGGPGGEDDENQARLECLSCCLNDLSAENRELILGYYRGAGGREKIEVRRRLAEKLGIPPGALRSRAVRLRERLKILVTKNLKKQII